MLKARILPLVLCAALGAAAELPARLSRTLDRISANSLRGHVSFLASDLLEGRDTPSPGLDIAGEYIAAQFRRAGLEGVGEGGYFQTAQFVSITPNLEGFEFVFEREGKSFRVPKENVSVQNTGEVSLSRARVFKIVLDAGSAEPLSAAQVDGKVLLVGAKEFNMKTFEALSRMRSSLAKFKPAAVVVFTAMARRGGPLLRDSAEVQQATVQTSDADLRKAFDALAPGDSDAAISLHIAAAKQEPAILRNVAGLLRGSDPILKDTYVLVTAHYDHIGVIARGDGDRINNGADDNASGTAGVMELASALSAMNPRPKRSILFVAFFGEEKGLLGSRYYTRHPLVPLAKTVANVNLEELGRTDDTDGPQVSKLSMTGYGYTDMTAVFQKAGRLTGIEIPTREKKSDAFFSGSDNLSFAQKGIPAHTVSVVYLYPDYHRPGDEWQKLDYANMEKVSRMIAVAVQMIADCPEAPKWNGANPKTAPYINARQ